MQNCGNDFTYVSANFLWFDLTHFCSGLGLLLSILSAVRNAKKALCGPNRPMLKFKQYGIDRTTSVAKPLR